MGFLGWFLGRRSSPAPKSSPQQPVKPIPLLPEVGVAIQPLPHGTLKSVASQSLMSDGSYTCDLGAQSCTCGDFQIYRREMASNGSLKLCKHLRQALAEAGGVTFSEPGAQQLWLERGGRIFRWTSPEGRVAFISVDPTREWINISLGMDSGTSDENSFGWNPEGKRWSYGQSPKGFAKALLPALQEMAILRETMLLELGKGLEKRWEQNRNVFEGQERENAKKREEVERGSGLLCGVCSTPLGHPWGVAVGTEILCATCEYPNVVVDERRADAAERVMVDWKYYDDPRPGGGKGIFTLAKEQHAVDISRLRSRLESGELSEGAIKSEQAKVERKFSAQFDALHQERHAELEDIRRRIKNTQSKMKRRAAKAAKGLNQA